ncbi:MAG: zinc ribbon domain-containing protein [Candidatus Lokiarchaeota archaeon]
MVGWILRTIAIPNINPYTIMKTVQALAKQAIDNKDKQKVMAPVSETKNIELDKVPEEELRRPKASGWVKEEAPEVLKESEIEKRKAFQEHMKTKDEETLAPSKEKKTRRELHKIPGGNEVSTEGEEETGDSTFCPYCGKDLGWKYCPYCGKELPHK